MDNGKLYGIAMGDASGVGPEILLKAYRQGEIAHRTVVFGDIAALEFYNERLGYGVKFGPDALNVKAGGFGDIDILTQVGKRLNG